MENIITTAASSDTLTNVVNYSLPALSGAQATYDAQRAMFITEGWPSPAGNYYYEALRVSPRLTLFYEIGVGYAYTFLNGLRLFCNDGRKHRLIGQRWFSCNILSEMDVRKSCEEMLGEYLLTQNEMLNQRLTREQIEPVIKRLVDELYHNSRNRLNQ